jgi:hypothetical protein
MAVDFVVFFAEDRFFFSSSTTRKRSSRILWYALSVRTLLEIELEAEFQEEDIKTYRFSALVDLSKIDLRPKFIRSRPVRTRRKLTFQPLRTLLYGRPPNILKGIVKSDLFGIHIPSSHVEEDPLGVLATNSWASFVIKWDSEGLRGRDCDVITGLVSCF